MEGKDAIELGYYKELQLLPTLVGVLVAAVVGYLAIRFMLRIISRVPLSWFALYLALLGLLFLILQLANVDYLPAFAVSAAAVQ